MNPNYTNYGHGSCGHVFEHVIALDVDIALTIPTIPPVMLSFVINIWLGEKMELDYTYLSPRLLCLSVLVSVSFGQYLSACLSVCLC